MAAPPPLLVLGLVISCLGGCTRFFPAPIPMRAIDYPATASASATRPPRPNAPNARCLVVFLPGMGDSAEAFEKNGMVDEVQRRGLSIDIVAAHATIGYYSRGIFVERLAADVIEPRRARGYEQLWLIGPSMGGFGTLFYSRERTPQVSGVLALAPFLGDRDLIDEVDRAGGLRRWPAPPRADKLDDDNYQREMWRWLQAVTQGKEPAPALFVGFGTKDDLAFADGLLAAELPKDRVYRVDGGHSWVPWRALLAQFLDRGPLMQNCR